MAEYSNLSATINAQIRANGVQAITGPVLNAVLTAMVNVLGDGYRLAGVAHPADNPGSPDNRVAYLAAEDGTYTNFGGLTVSGEVVLLLWDSAWTKATLVSIDAAVTPGSDNLITSGAVDSAISALATAYMQLVPGATGDNVASFAAGGQVKDSGIAAEDLVVNDGIYADLFAGFAGNLVDTRSAGTAQGPFAFRQSGGDGVNYMPKIKGRTIVWNQSCDNGEAARSRNTSNYGSYTCAVVNGHKYFFSFVSNLTAAATGQTWRLFTGSQAHNFGPLTTGRQRVSAILSATVNATSMSLYANYVSQADENDGTVEDVMIVDLTLLGLGDLTTAQFQALFHLPYYNYNAGVLKNNAATSLQTVGFNQWDEEVTAYGPTSIQSANYIPVFPSTVYYFNIPSGMKCDVLFYDANKVQIGSTDTGNTAGVKTTRAGSAYIKFRINLTTPYGGNTYNHDICINISDASRNGDYEPYWKRSVYLGLDSIACTDEYGDPVTVNGLDGVGTSQDEAQVENGKAVRIIKRRERIDLGSISWSIQDQGGTHERATSSALRGLIRPNTANNVVPNLIASKYIAITPNATNSHTTEGISVDTTGDLYIYAAAFIGLTGAQVQAALSGVYLDYELLTPVELSIDSPFRAFIEVDSLGTEERRPGAGVDPQGPFESDSNYSVSTANLVRLLNL